VNRQNAHESSSTSENTQKVADEARSRGEDAASAVQERADQGMDRAAEGMQQGAEKLRDYEDSSTTGKAAGFAADGMERGAQYLRDRDSTQVWDDVGHYVEQHPAQAMLGAVGVGFLIGRILR